MAANSTGLDLRFTSAVEAVAKREQLPSDAWSLRKKQRTLFVLGDVPAVGSEGEVDGSRIVYTFQGRPFEIDEPWVRRVGAHLRPILGQTAVFCYWRRLGTAEPASE